MPLVINYMIRQHTTWPEAVSVILPTYNEVTNVVPLIYEIFVWTAQVKINTEIVVVDDDSTDGTGEILTERFRLDKRVKLVIRKGQRSLATAIWRGIIEAEHSVIAIMDSDFNHTPRDLMQLLGALNNYDLIIGSRFLPGGGMNTSTFRYCFSRGFNFLVRFFLDVPFTDNLSGFLAAPKKIWQEISPTLFKGYGDYSIRLIFYAYYQGFKIKEIPIVYENRLGGESKTRFFYHFIQYLRTVLSLRREVTIRRIVR